MNPQDIAAIWLTLKVAGVTTLLLFVISIPLAWWLARTRSSLKAPISAIVAVPLVLPPSVLGFYLLLAMGPEGPIGWGSSRRAKRKTAQGEESGKSCGASRPACPGRWHGYSHKGGSVPR